MKLDIALAEKVERAEALALRSIVTHTMQVFPDRGIALEEIGGATVAYCAPQSNFNKAIGLGLRGTVGEDDVERIVEFFHSRGETARVDITPVGDAALAAKLGRRGFVLDDYENALVADLTEISGRRDARVEASTDPDEWSRGFGRAVTAGGVPGEKRPFMRFVMATHPEIIPLLLREDGRIVTHRLPRDRSRRLRRVLLDLDGTGRARPRISIGPYRRPHRACPGTRQIHRTSNG
jgi:hypothetical protein